YSRAAMAALDLDRPVASAPVLFAEIDGPSPGRLRSLGITIVGVGALAQLAGVTLDAWAHVHQSALAEHEAVFSFTNPAHALLIVGIAMVLLGAFLAIAGPRLERARTRAGRLGPPAALVGVMLVAGLIAANSSLAKTHSHLFATPV